MVFQNKGALWLLVGIPILIIIYLIRSHHEDYPVSSTYIWKLSAKFRKKRLPMQKFRRILLFVTQLLLIATVALAIAGPSIPNGECCNYILIIDCSASMNTADDNGQTRFERALEKASEYKERINEGHMVSVISAADTSAILLRDSNSENDLKYTLSNLSCGNGRMDLSGAVALAETVASGCAKAEVVFITDSDYETGDKTNVVNVNAGEWNVCVTGVQAVINSEGMTVNGLIYSEGKSSKVTVGLKIDGVTRDVCEVNCVENQTTPVSFTEPSIKSYETAEVYVIAKDGLSQDNRYIVCNQKTGSVNVLLVSDSPFYLESCLDALPNCKATVISTDSDTEIEGYNLYIFDGYTPETLPEDGSILFINCENLNIVGIGERVESEKILTKGNPADFAKKLSGLLDNISASSVYLSAYTPLFTDSSWSEVFYSGSDCVMCAQVTDAGFVRAVLGFDIHESNLTMLPDFVYLMNNIIDVALPAIIYENDYTYGESIDFVMLPASSGLYLEAPSGKVITLSGKEKTISYTPSEVGVYTAVEKIGDSGSYADFFVHIALEESITPEKGIIAVNLYGGSEGDESGTIIDATPALTPLWFYFLLAALILLIIEWEVYYYEQY